MWKQEYLESALNGAVRGMLVGSIVGLTILLTISYLTFSWNEGSLNPNFTITDGLAIAINSYSSGLLYGE